MGVLGEEGGDWGSRWPGQGGAGVPWVDLVAKYYEPVIIITITSASGSPTTLPRSDGWLSLFTFVHSGTFSLGCPSRQVRSVFS